MILDCSREMLQCKLLGASLIFLFAHHTIFCHSAHELILFLHFPSFSRSFDPICKNDTPQSGEKAAAFQTIKTYEYIVDDIPPVVTCGFDKEQDLFHVLDPEFVQCCNNTAPFPSGNKTDPLHISDEAPLIDTKFWYQITVSLTGEVSIHPYLFCLIILLHVQYRMKLQKIERFLLASRSRAMSLSTTMGEMKPKFTKDKSLVHQTRSNVQKYSWLHLLATI